MAEILIRYHAPEWATEIDFSTLREESTGLVSKKTLQRRYPDMIWSSDTVNGERVLFLLEFQRTVERLMALRTTTHAALSPDDVRVEELPGKTDEGRSEDHDRGGGQIPAGHGRVGPEG